MDEQIRISALKRIVKRQKVCATASPPRFSSVGCPQAKTIASFKASPYIYRQIRQKHKTEETKDVDVYAE